MPPKKPHTIPFTKDAYEALQTNLEKLLVKEQEVVARLTVAREQGDLSENGAYKYAKQELGDVRRQMRDMRYKLLFGTVATASQNGVVEFGSFVTLSDGKKNVRYQLVGKFESDPSIGKISKESPLGSLLLGKKMGDTVVVTTPNGSVSYTIRTISLS